MLEPAVLAVVDVFPDLVLIARDVGVVHDPATTGFADVLIQLD